MFDLYQAGRQGGKTTWLLEQTEIDISEGRRVAIVLPVSEHSSHVEYEVKGWADVYSEKTFECARGREYDRVYIDNADLFLDSPVELCRRVTPGVPVAMTYTPSENSSLPTRVDRLNWQESDPTLRVKVESWTAQRLVESVGRSPRHTTGSLLASAAVVGL